MIIGYARISSEDQNLARQIEKLKGYDCDMIFEEAESAKNFERPVYQKMKSNLGYGNVLVVESLSRFGRNAEAIKNEWEYLTKRDIDIVVMDTPILDTRKYKELEGVGKLITNLVLDLLSFQVEQERKNIKRAQAQGIKIAKENGKYKGAKTIYTKDHEGIKHAIKLYQEDNRSIADISRITKITRPTLYKKFREFDITR